MDTPSAFQLQHPLSPKKFWKKMIEKIVPILVFSFILNAIFVSFYITFTRNLSIFTVLFWIPAFLIIGGLYGWYVKVYIQRYYYDCGDSIITIKKKVLTPTEIHVQYQKIQDVYVDQDLLDRLLGIYDVHIASATYSSGIEAHIDGVNKEVADALKEYILAKMQNRDVPHTKSGESTSISASAGSGDRPSSNHNTTAGSNGNISSTMYPISAKWMSVAVISSFFAALYITIIVLLLFGRIFFEQSDTPDYGNFWLVTVITFVVAFAAVIIRNIIWRKNFYFEFTPEYVLRRTSVIGTQETHLPYKSIQDVILKQGLIERFFGLGTVVIQNAAQNFAMPSRRSIFSLMAAAQNAGGVALVGQPYEKAKELNDLLNSIVQKKNQSAQNMGV